MSQQLHPGLAVPPCKKKPLTSLKLGNITSYRAFLRLLCASVHGASPGTLLPAAPRGLTTAPAGRWCLSEGGGGVGIRAVGTHYPG